ncbi:MAG TPA: pirin family protein [Candidatus Sulfotelmatobacter sp.]|nr:pirin family protein [Candidatus Sulfotelmatobacter sp.]
MSWHPADEAAARTDVPGHALETIIVPRSRDIGGFEVRRVLPAAKRRMVGPFVFFDQMGPAGFAPGAGLDVRPHPHIGLATVTYLFEGEQVHRDTLGTAQTIRPGDVNWMTAGRGIAHSERTDPALRRTGSRLAGIQSWVALPKAHEETEPAFVHHPSASLPLIEADGARVRLIAGALWGARSPLQTFSETLYADIALDADATLEIAADHAERALYPVDGVIALDGETYEAGQLLVLKPGAVITLGAFAPARVMLLGGEPMDGPRHIWWNFVSSSAERIEQAKADWKAGRFPKIPGDDVEFIPLPAR